MTYQEDILDNFRGLPLTVRMRAAASVIRDAREEHYRRGGEPSPSSPALYCAGDLHQIAGEWEQEDVKKAAEEAEIEELAQLLYSNAGNPWSWAEVSDQSRERWHSIARGAIDAGWRKAEKAS